ncbi:MAG: exodeoxyribonuclease VII large subunit [Kiritimatiellia bacterium]
MNAPAKPEVFSVTAITRRIRFLLEEEIGSVWIEGEVSNFTQAGSGHIYFSLKDENAQIKAAFFRGSQTGLKIQPANGMQVRVQGEVTLYEKTGNCQIIVRRMEPAGAGALQEAFEKLKAKLEAEGLFSPERKRPLPVLPRHIGIVTSPTGAAIRDMLNVLGRRFPNLHIVIAPVRVQGEGAAAEIAAAIGDLNKLGTMDVIIAGRGGGSIEDLWAFNEEVVARAIAASGVPVISAVGHETDFTIADFVADLRAPTPSAAAELVIDAKENFENLLVQRRRQLARSLETLFLKLKQRLVRAEHSYVFREPRSLVKNYALRVEHLDQSLRQRLLRAAQIRHQQTDTLNMRLSHLAQSVFQSNRQRVRQMDAQLRALNPHAVLERGYSVTRGADGKVIRDFRQVKPGAALATQLARGRVDSTVTGAQP